MNVYTNNTFTGLWPVGTAAVVVAPDRETAANMLQVALAEQSIPAQLILSTDMIRLDIHQDAVRILADGNY